MPTSSWGAEGPDVDVYLGVLVAISVVVTVLVVFVGRFFNPNLIRAKVTLGRAQPPPGAVESGIEVEQIHPQVE